MFSVTHILCSQNELPSTIESQRQVEGGFVEISFSIFFVTTKTHSRPQSYAAFFKLRLV